MLGGVPVESGMGLSGHSDADVLLHAICDAILGALGMGDLGEHFPETPEYKNISSVLLLERVAGMMDEKGYRLINLDCIIHAEEPRLAPYRARMIAVIAAALGARPQDVSVKATRGEGLGPVGEKKGMAASAVVLIESK